MQTRPDARRSRTGVWRVVFWVAIVVLVCALAALAVIGFSYWQGQQKYASIAEEALEDSVLELDSSAAEGSQSLAAEFVDWDVLLSENPDTVGWIYVSGTSVSYPIVQASNNDTYLHTDFSGEESWPVSYGAIFLDAMCESDFSSDNNIVYGHHMNDGSMFAALADFVDPEAFNAHRTIYVFTPAANYRLETFAILVVPSNDPLAQAEFADDQERLSYISDKMERSVVSPDPAFTSAEETETVFTFVTCTDYTASDERVVLFAAVVDSAVPGGAEENGAGA